MITENYFTALFAVVVISLVALTFWRELQRNRALKAELELKQSRYDAEGGLWSLHIVETLDRIEQRQKQVLQSVGELQVALYAQQSGGGDSTPAL